MFCDLPVEPECGFKADQLLLLPNLQDVAEVYACLIVEQHVHGSVLFEAADLYEEGFALLSGRSLVQTVFRLKQDPLVGCC